MILSDRPGFVVRTEAEKAAFDNGFRLPLANSGPWLGWRSASAPAAVWIAAAADGAFILAHDHAGAAKEVAFGEPFPAPAPPGCFGPWRIGAAPALHAAVARLWRLAASLPDAPVERFRKRMAEAQATLATEAEAIIRRRVGQDVFREALMAYWGGRCPITGVSDPELLRASHITPWAEADYAERLDVHNGLLLSALWDAAFDRGLVGFADDGTALASPKLTQAGRHALGLAQSLKLRGLQPSHRLRLANHRARWGLGNDEESSGALA